MELSDLAAYLDSYLYIAEVPDHPNAMNGLQVTGTRQVRRAAFAVDACLHTIRCACSEKADVLIVHHGLFWDGCQPITGNRYQRLQPLLREGIGLYSCHLPLDAHPEVGNNAVLCRLLGITPCGTWAAYEGRTIGVIAEANIAVPDLCRMLDERLNTMTRAIECGPPMARRVAILSGNGATHVAEAAAKGCDTLITGEISHHCFLIAEEAGLNILTAGHYATECPGLRALQQHLAERFGLETVFIDHPTGL